ncbi:MAG: alpha/beta hydrolase [Candidatus Heimdallarchaeota archaeon]|nr:alpha/beta hydrolase [Candidatus Heimdallarchaeota archaeon]
MKNFPKVPVKMLMNALYQQKKEGINEKLARINSPVMLINGTAGLLTNRNSVEQYFEVIPAKKKYGLVVEGATHTVHKSKQHKEILAHIIKFIAEILESKGTTEKTEKQLIITLSDN